MVTFNGTVIVKSKKALKSKAGEVFAHVASFAFMGGCLETKVPERIFNDLGIGETGTVAGSFDQDYKGSLELTVTAWKPTK